MCVYYIQFLFDKNFHHKQRVYRWKWPLKKSKRKCVKLCKNNKKKDLFSFPFFYYLLLFYFIFLFSIFKNCNSFLKFLMKYFNFSLIVLNNLKVSLPVLKVHQL